MSRDSDPICEACKKAPVQECVESFCPQQPFQLCTACAHRLRTFSLRPLEYFNLAAAHTFLEHYLHDDFYDEDGTAQQCQEEVVSPESFLSPTLEHARQDSEKLLDYAFSRWSLKDRVIQALQSHEKKAALVESLAKRVLDSANPNVEGRAYEICAALGPAAESWIRERWHVYHPGVISQLIQATAKCLPISEGFPVAAQALEEVPAIKLIDIASALAYFQSSLTLDWIEKHASELFFHSWGRLAALSNLSWERVCSWLQRGRPMTLVGLSALHACWNYNTPLQRKLRPKLLNPVSASDMTKKMQQYASQDPLIQSSIPELVAHWDEICGKADKSL